MTARSNDHPFFANLLLFTGMLRRAGLPVSLNQTTDFIRSMDLIDIGSRDQVYYAARSLLVNRKENIALFDALFNLFWRLATLKNEPRGQKSSTAPRHARPEKKRLTIAALMAQKAQQSDTEIEIADRAGSFSRAEVLQLKEFSQMTPEELAAVKKLIQSMRWQVSFRQTHRLVPNRQGSYLDLRRIMRDAAKHGGTPLKLYWQSRKIKARPLVLLADISGSMEKYSRLLLQFCYSVGHSLGNVESFVFGTRLSRITPQLRLKNIDRAIDQAAQTVLDWSGGTRIGESLQVFNREWSRRILGRGAIVLIISDGWERGDMSTLQRAMRYLQHRCYRLIWLNPLLGKTTYQPLVEGMNAALPFIDDFLPIHNLQSLESFGEHLATLGRRRSVKQMVTRSH